MDLRRRQHQRRGNGSVARAARCAVEALERRQLLAANEPFINEFLANNDTTPFLDDYNQRSDWIELYNPTLSPVNVGGWHLTDRKSEPGRWTFPAGTTIPAQDYLVVFATNRQTSVGPGGKLHTNFSLDADGEYLALTRPDNSVASAFDPEFPEQLDDISYGSTPANAGVSVVGPGAESRTLIPAADIGTAWRTQPSFNDGGWINGTTGVGYEKITVSGFRTRMVDTAGGSDGSINNIGEAMAILDGTTAPGAFLIASDRWQTSPDVNFGDAGDLGFVSGFRTWPGVGAAANNAPEREQFATRTTANLFIPQGTWTFNVASNAGFRLKIPGVSFANVFGANSAGLPTPVPADTLAYGAVRSNAHTSGTFTLAAPLTTTLTLDHFETNGNDMLELTVASGTTTWAASNGANFRLLSAGIIPPGGGGGSFNVTSDGGGNYAPLIGTPIPQMQNANATAYVRVPFTLAELDGLTGVRLRMKYDDGFVAYVNGTKVAERNAPASLFWNSSATAERNNAAALIYEDIDITAFASALVEGDNVLAIQALNFSAANNDLLVLPELALSYELAPGLQYMKTPTPGQANVAGALGQVSDTNFSVDRGFYQDPFDVIISTKQSDADIYYTTNGSSPLMPDGTLAPWAIRYDGPLHVATTTTLRAVAVKPGYLPSDVDTQTYIFLNDVIRQPTNPANFPTVWTDNWPSTPYQGQMPYADYAMDPDIVDDPAYTADLMDGLTQLPSMSIVMDMMDLFGDGTPSSRNVYGIYTHPEAQDVDNAVNPIWERATSIEFMYPDGTEGFQIDAGIQIQGGDGSRLPLKTPKHGFRLLFKDRFGPTKLNYEMYGDEGAEQFDALILKGIFGNSWLHWEGAQRIRAQYVHDRWASEVQAAMGDPSKRGRFIHLYLNGAYWGIYDLGERPEGKWASEYYGGPEEDWDVINNEARLIDGNMTAWNQMFAVANAGLAGAAQYQEIKKYLDIPEFINYILINGFGDNQDWDDHNWYAIRRSRNAGVATNQFGGFRFITFDSERILENPFSNGWSNINRSNRPTRLFTMLRQNPEFRLAFADAAHKHLFNDGVLTPEAAAARWQKLTSIVEDPLVAESARWGDYRRDHHVYQFGPYDIYKRDTYWTAERARMMNEYFPQRTGVLLDHLRAIGLYPNIDAPEYNQFGGPVAGGFQVSIANSDFLPPGAIVYYTLDGSDPRALINGVPQPAPGALTYSGPITLSASTRVKARALDPASGTWSAITDAAFVVGAPPPLRVSEIMYNPADPTPGVTFLKDDFEFIELKNTGASPIDPKGIRFTDGITFVFPQDAAVIAPGARVVLVRNLAAFQSRYGNAIPVAGTYTGELSDNGERLTLMTSFGQLVQTFRYADGWFDQTDGDGFSLVAIDPAATAAVLSTQEGWRSSQPPGGAPGADDPGRNNNSIVVNEVMANGATNWIELKNQTAEPIDLSGWYLSDDNQARTKWTIPSGTIPAGGYLLFNQTGGFGSAFTLSPFGGDIYLTSPHGAGIGGYRDHVDFDASAPGVSSGRHVKSTGGSDFTALSTPTPGAANDYPMIGPVVINEVMYNPLGLSREFVELRNITDTEVSLAGWRFTDGINFTFPAGATIGPNAHVLVVPIEPATYRGLYNVPADVAIFGPYTGLIDNAGERIALSKPGTPVGEVTPFITVDRVNHDNDPPWPAAANGTGPSLGRINAGRYGNDPANWRADSTNGSGGAANALPPVVMLPWFGYDPSPTIRLKLNKEIAGAVAKTDVIITNLSTGTAIDMAGVSFVYDVATSTASWSLPRTFTDGNYRLTLSSAAVQDAQGRHLDGNSDGTGGDDFTYEFYHLRGDANRDRKVNHGDFTILYANMGQTGRQFTHGDFDFDGDVDFRDFQALEKAFGKTLAPPVAATQAPSPVPVPVTPVKAVPKQPSPAKKPVLPPKRPSPTVMSLPLKQAKAPFARRVIRNDLLA